MAKLKKSPITAQDLTEFVNADSDFGFEMRVLNHLRTDGFTCSHSGTYRDPITDKIRQYDIRAHKDRGDLTLALALECKNLQPHNPLLLSTAPRTADESFHDVIYFHNEASFRYPEVIHQPGNSAVYKAGEFVGRKTDQVAREDSGGQQLISNDEATFEKVQQAVNSCNALIRQFIEKTSSPFRRVIVPVLVVPTGLLWQVDYDTNGSVAIGPRQVDRASFFYDHSWSASAGYVVGDVSYRLSHLEIVTFGSLSQTTNFWLGAGGFLPVTM